MTEIIPFPQKRYFTVLRALPLFTPVFYVCDYVYVAKSESFQISEVLITYYINVLTVAASSSASCRIVVHQIIPIGYSLENMCHSISVQRAYIRLFLLILVTFNT